jgi:hypothetical protein
MGHDDERRGWLARGLGLALLAGSLAIGGTTTAMAEGARGEFGLAAGPPWNCPPALQSQAANCVAAFVLSKDMSWQVCPCNLHGASESTMPIPPDWTATTYTQEITKWKPPTGSDPCVTYTIGGVLKQICW